MKLFLLTLLLCPFSVIGAGDRVALVIGCSRYTNLSEGKQLTSPVADATDVAAELKALGYTIVNGGAVTDAGKDAIITATESFATQAKDAEAAVFYFSGHGLQVGDDNFLMPSDTPRITSYTVLKNRGVHLRDSVMVGLEEARTKTKVIILDCCRENPFAEQVDQALGQIGKSMRTKGGLGEISGYGPGFFLAFATSPGTQADDGNGQRNSPFTAALLAHLKASATEDITPLFRKVKATVRQGNSEDQVPWTNDSLDEPFSLASASASPPPVTLPHAATLETNPTVTMPPAHQTPARDSASAVADRLPALRRQRDDWSEKHGFPARGFYTLDEIFAGTAYASFNSHTRTVILKKAQDRLKMADFYHGDADGAPDPDTHMAIKSWQAQMSIAITGLLDEKTLLSMNLTGIVEEASPPPINRKPASVARPNPAPTSRPSENSDDAFREAIKRLNRL